MKNTFVKTMFPVFENAKMKAMTFFILRSLGISTKGKPRAQERPSQQGSLSISSSAFEDYGMIPMKYTCDGENISPPLEISNVPNEANSLALVMHDSDAPVEGGWTHWIVFNIKPESHIIFQEGSIPSGVMEGTTNFQKPGYGGPCPPSGTHHYEFRLYALNKQLSLGADTTKSDLEHAMEGNVIASAILMGIYAKQGKQNM